MVGPHMPWPIMNRPESLPNGPSSCCQITRSIGDEPRPPYSFGQCRQAQPASAFFFCQAFATSSMLAFLSWVRPSEDLRSSSSYCLGALAAIQARAVARNSASCGVSPKFIVSSLGSFPGRCAARSGALLIRGPLRPLGPGSAALRAASATRSFLRRVLIAHAVDQLVFPIGQAAEPERHGVGAAVVHVAVELPGETHAAVNLDVVLGAVLERLRRADAGGGGRFRQFGCVGR